MAEHDLRRGEKGLQIYVMCEIPSNVILAEEFARRFDGFSIGSNDLTQLVLGVDRDSAELADLFDERDAAVKRMIVDVIERAHRCGTKVGICGQAPSNYPDFAAFLVETGIDSISLNPDSFIATVQVVAAEGTGANRAAISAVDQRRRCAGHECGDSRRGPLCARAADSRWSACAMAIEDWRCGDFRPHGQAGCGRHHSNGRHAARHHAL